MSQRSSTGSSRRAGGARERRRAKSKGDGGSRSDAGRVLHLDCFSGIAGDMMLGALLDLGLRRADLESDLAGLGLEHRLVVRSVRRGALAAKSVDVRLPRKPGSRGGRRRAGDHTHLHSGSPSAAHGRGYLGIVHLLERAGLASRVRELALAIFGALARAEARVHGIPVEKVHFHEVGAVDAIVDVTGAAIGLVRLGVTRVTASPVALGSGSVRTEHGLLPLPAPATLELLRGVPTVPAHVAWETVTPTGAAILRTLAEDFGPLPAMTVEAVGHGAGREGKPGLPNVLRAVLGRAGGASADRVACLETNLDDLVPEHFDYLMERLFEAGALDVSLQPLQMKKNRPGVLLRVLARPSEKGELARLLFAESTAIGVRVNELDRIVLHREVRPVRTPFGRIAVKFVRDADGRESVSAEVDDCVKAARRHGVPLREVVRVAEEAARK